MAATKHHEQPAANQISNYQLPKLVIAATKNSIDRSEAILGKSKIGNLIAQEDRPQNWWNVFCCKLGFWLTKSIEGFCFKGNSIEIVSVMMIFILSFSLIVLPVRADSEKDSESIETISIPEQEIEVVLDSDSTEESETSSAETISIPEQEIEAITDTSSQPEEEISTPVEIIDTPNTLVAPQKPETLTIETIPPEPIITPEQNFLTSVQKRIGEITNQYGEDLIVTGSADLLDSHLSIQVSDDWYQLSKSRQDELANEILKRSQTYNLSKLEIQDSQNNLVARSPVVGNQMIILQRTN